MLSILIADDEPIARKGLRRVVESFPGAELAGECRNGAETVEKIRSLTPDIVLLDIRMPDLSGFEVIEKIGVENMPVVIFVTAFDQYAVKAFEMHALDYVLKPIDPDRVYRAIHRASDQIGGKASNTGPLQEVLAFFESKSILDRPLGPERLMVKDGNRVSLIALVSITWIGAAGNYVEIHVGDASHLLRATMREMEERLRKHGFVRISRSGLVNSAHVSECILRRSGGYTIYTSTGARLESSRAHREDVEAMLAASV